MKAVLISINKPHTDNIFTTRNKTIEWRKKPLPLTTHYGYETKNKGGIGKVRGQFDVVRHIEFNPELDFYNFGIVEAGCVPIEDLIEYADGDVIYGNVLENIEEYDKPKELGEFKLLPCDYNADNECIYRGKCKHQETTMCWGYITKRCNKQITRPPQSWCYVEEMLPPLVEPKGKTITIQKWTYDEHKGESE